MIRPTLVWTGDLNDDCFLSWRGMGAHVELMHRSPVEDWPSDWFCCVYFDGQEDYIFHSTGSSISFEHAPAAREFCEAVMILTDLEMRFNFGDE